MTRFFRLLLLTVLMVVLGGSLILPAFAQDEVPEVHPLFTLANEMPIVARGDTRSWDYTYTDPGAVVYHDGQFHMFRNGFNGWPSSVQIGYLVSDDGVNWTEPQDDPVIRTLDVDFAEIAALASSVLVEDDGTWVLYFYTWNTRRGQNGLSAIGRATAPEPLGPWTIDAEPVLTPSGEGWDATSVTAPSVIKTEDGYVMYYSGYDENDTQRIGRATSADGIMWIKDEAPVLEAEAEWEGFAHQPHVVVTPDGWVMLYRTIGSQAAAPGGMRLNIATSEDGITWTRYAENPVFAAAEVQGAQVFWWSALAYNDGSYYLYVEITPATSRGNTDIFVLTYTGTLPPA